MDIEKAEAIVTIIQVILVITIMGIVFFGGKWAKKLEFLGDFADVIEAITDIIGAFKR